MSIWRLRASADTVRNKLYDGLGLLRHLNERFEGEGAFRSHFCGHAVFLDGLSIALRHSHGVR